MAKLALQGACVACVALILFISWKLVKSQSFTIYIQGASKKSVISEILLNDVCLYAKTCRSFRVHCRDTNTFPVVPRHTLVSYLSGQEVMKGAIGLFTVFRPPSHILLITLFFEAPCIYSEMSLLN